MTDRTNPGRSQREDEAARAKQKEGTGTVPNVAPGENAGESKEVRELKKAAHDLEEEKGDWAKDR
jgi:hypothetical protein